jgi:hypothetical protein
MGGPRRTKFHRQKTISGDSFGSSMLTRAISRTYTFTSNASSSIPVDEWKRIFDKFDIESDGIADGKIPVRHSLYHSCDLFIRSFIPIIHWVIH